MINSNHLIYSIFNYVRRNAPYDTGNLHDKGFYGPYILGKEPYFVIGGTDAPYGVWLNNWSHIQGRVNPHYRWITDRTLEAISLSGAIIVDARYM